MGVCARCCRTGEDGLRFGGLKKGRTFATNGLFGFFVGRGGDRGELKFAGRTGDDTFRARLRRLSRWMFSVVCYGAKADDRAARYLVRDLR